MTQKELDLLHFSSRQMAESRTCTAEIVRSEVLDSGLASPGFDVITDCFRREPSPHTFPSRFTRRKIGPPLAPDALVQSSTARFAQPARERCEYVFLCRSSPPEHSGLRRAGNRPSSTQQAPHGGARTRSIARESHGRACRGLLYRQPSQQISGLVNAKPIPDSDAQLPGTFDAADACGKFRGLADRYRLPRTPVAARRPGER